MSSVFCKTILLLMFITVSTQAASLLNLKVNFENNSWREVLHKAYGQGKYAIQDRKAGGKCLKIPAGLMLETQKFPYYKGNIQVSFDAKTTNIEPGNKPYKVVWCSVFFYDKNGKAIGHNDVLLTKKARDWQKKTKLFKKMRSDTAFFRIIIGNVGKSGTLWVDDVEINIEVDGKKLCGDPSFAGAFAVDHWYYPSEGVDWDNLKLAANTGKAEYQSDIFPDGGKSLHLKNTATFKSARYTYNGESLVFGGWVKQKNIKTGIKGWAKSGVQLVIYNAQGEIIGHRDFSPFKNDSFKWQYFSSFIPSGTLRRDAAYLEIWARIFEGATGEAWFDQVQLIKLSDNELFSKKYDAAKALITIDATKPAAITIRPVWNSTDISYFMVIKEKVAKKALSMMRQNGVSVLRCREFLKGGKILQQIANDGELAYNWKYLDNILDWVVKKQKFTLTATIESTPEQLANKPDKRFFNRNAPQNFKLWGKVVEDLIIHWIKRYGLENVKKWQFECWNEPHASYYFHGTTEQFVKIFNAYIDAMKRVEKIYNTSLNVATFSGVANSPLYKMIFDNLQNNKKLAAVNMISMHIYAGYVNSFSYLENSIKSTKTLVDSYPELKGVPLILTEVNGSSMSSHLNDSSIAAAWNVKANLIYLNTGVKAGYFFTVIDYLYNRSNTKKYFCGYLGAFTKAGTPKPVFNSIVLLNRLHGGKRLPLSSSNEPIGGIAVLDKDSVKILLTSFDETKLDKTLNTKVKVVVNWPTVPGKIQGTMYRVDKDHANSYTAWQKMGKPEINPEATLKLEQANQLTPEEFTAFKIKNGKLSFNMDMPVNSIVYLEFK